MNEALPLATGSSQWHSSSAIAGASAVAGALRWWWLQRRAQQTAGGQDIRRAPRHAKAVALGRRSGYGAQQGIMALRQGLPVGADDVREDGRALGGTILVALLGRGDNDQQSASLGAGLVEQLLRFAFILVIGIGV